MIEYAETGLPWDAATFKAYMAFAKTPGTGPDNMDHPVKVAQLFNNVAADNQQLQALAFLAYVPEGSYGPLEKRFGAETISFAREISAHMRTGYAYIDEASPTVKAFAMADGAAWVDTLDEKFYDLAAIAQEADEKGVKPQFPAVVVPSQRVLDTIARFALKSSGYGDLENAFLDRVERFRDTTPEKFEVLGIQPPPPVEYKPFEQTGLLNVPDVRNAYDALTRNPRVSADDLEVATEAAQLLSSQPSTRNPTAIAEALLDLAIQDRNMDDLRFLQGRIGWGVLELFANYNVRQGVVPGGLQEAPIEVRQTTLSFAAVALHRSLKNVEKMFTFMDENPERFEGSMAETIKSSQLTQLGGQLRHVQGFLKELGDSAEAPELKGLVETKIDAIAGFIAEKTPRKLLALPAPKKKPGKGFDLKPGASFDL
ncbi:MAG TPA: hypothetical protein VEF76_12790 [Patescibacteria group bacterium]|nr:hypothetical protein [Patescibacteria group bacterium]